MTSSESDWDQMTTNFFGETKRDKRVHVQVSSSEIHQVSPSESQWNQMSPTESKWARASPGVRPRECTWDQWDPPILLSTLSWFHLSCYHAIHIYIYICISLFLQARHNLMGICTFVDRCLFPCVLAVPVFFWAPGKIILNIFISGFFQAIA